MDDIYFYQKASFECGINPDALRGKRTVLLISVGQDYHESDKLVATITLINASDFAECTIAVADTLQQHNREDPKPEQNRMLTYQPGEDWLQRNDARIKALRIPHNILRWDEARFNSSCSSFYLAVKRAYQEETDYRSAVDETIARFTERALKRNPGLVISELKTKCLNYLLEECPIIMPMWASRGYEFIIYPQPVTSAMLATRTRFVAGAYPGKAQWLSLRFRRRSIPIRLSVLSESANQNRHPYQQDEKHEA
ncbi:hypothetical protein [Kosakonia sp. S42]|uniref:hypothetical protein n=1 Tax=Kosakonia sp. S42 TaxID=2767458 RepID=UPI0019097893|nr:hypothetical protein [Kosakonia sp. S42]MBK0018748.1 tRNA-dependent cyclodipeptide synthase [Kosakonia sp. S42]